MLFTAPSFLFLFLPAMLAIYALIPQHYRRYAILLFNLTYYAVAAWHRPESLLLALLTAAFTYSAGFVIAVTHKRGTLLAAIAVELAAFAIYRSFYDYADQSAFFPLGAAVYLLAAISYLTDIYRNDAPHAKNIADLLLYMFFFPVLVIGPILRYKDFISMLDRIEFSLTHVAEGIRLFLSGFIKRIAIAAVLSSTLDRIAQAGGDTVSLPLGLLALLLLAAEIWFAFSGYSEMARGLMAMLGMSCAPDFQLIGPGHSPSDFSRRWFGSLNRWIEDYLVYPVLRLQSLSSRTRRLITACLVCLLPALWIKSCWYILPPVLLPLLWRCWQILREPNRRHAPAKWHQATGRMLYWLLMTLSYFAFCAALSFDSAETGFLLIQRLRQGVTWAFPYAMYAIISDLNYLLIGGAALLCLIPLRPSAETWLQRLPRPVAIIVRTLALVGVMAGFGVTIFHFLPQFPQYAVRAFPYVVF